MQNNWSPFSYIVTNLARFIRPNEITFSGVNSTMPMLACLMAKKAYEWDFIYINVAGGVDPTPSMIPLSSSDPVLAQQSASIFANEDFYDLCTRGKMDLTYLGAARSMAKATPITRSSATGIRPRCAYPAAVAAPLCCPPQGAPAPGVPNIRHAPLWKNWTFALHGAAFMAWSHPLLSS